MRLNYYYNFKNNIRFFINIEKMLFDEHDLSYDNISWANPFKFRIKKDADSFRTLKIPNIYNFKAAYDIYKNELAMIRLDFEQLENLDPHKRMMISYELGEFKTNSYSENQLIDYNYLVKYDRLIRVDIKSFYQNIYTHYIFDSSTNRNIDKPLSKMNNGRTGGIIMGNYISLYFAEFFSTKISHDLKEAFEQQDIQCEFSYFSDDFYLFCDSKDVNMVIEIFDKVLEKYDLEKNNEKLEILDYICYTEKDLIEKYWKFITRECKNQQYSQEEKNKERISKGEKPLKNNNLFFTNQLIYRLKKIDDYKEQRVFIVNFFKSKFFDTIDFSNTFFQDYNFHQICYLIKNFPEIVMYIDHILQTFDIFKSDHFKELALLYFKNSLKSPYHDEQLYFFYLVYTLNMLDSLKSEDIYKLVLNSENQILMSYFIKYKLFSSVEIDVIKGWEQEEYWFVFYNLILNDNTLFSDLDASINKYLIPSKSRESRNPTNDNYLSFYKSNLENRVDILNSIEELIIVIKQYLRLKWESDDEIVEDNNDSIVCGQPLDPPIAEEPIYDDF